MRSLSISIPSLLISIFLITSCNHQIPSEAVPLEDLYCTFYSDTCRWSLDNKKGTSIVNLRKRSPNIASDGPITIPKSLIGNALINSPLNFMTLNSPIIDRNHLNNVDRCLSFNYYLYGPYADIQLIRESKNSKTEDIVWSRSVNAINKDSWSNFEMTIPNEGGYRFKIRSSTKEYSYAGVASIRTTSLTSCKEEINYCDFDKNWPGKKISFNCDWLKFENDTSYTWRKIYRTSVDNTDGDHVPIDQSSKLLSGQMLSTTPGGADENRATAKVSFKRSSRYATCLSFWYYKLDEEKSDEIFVYRTSFMSLFSTRLWSEKNEGKRNPVGQWNHVRMTIKSGGTTFYEDYEAGIGVTKNSNDALSRIFIDTITLAPGGCTDELSCEFSTDTCAYQTVDGNFRWSLGRGRVADPAKLGTNFMLPPSAHDFLYIDSTTLVNVVSNPDRIMRITSESTYPERKCVSFDFFKYRIDNTVPDWRESEIKLVTSATNGGFKATYFVIPKELNKWSRLTYPINPLSNFTISLQVDSDKLEGSFLAFKDLVVEPGDCSSPTKDGTDDGDDTDKNRISIAPGRYDCNFDEHPFNNIREEEGTFCNWRSVPGQNNSFKLGTSSSFKDYESLPRHDHTTRSKKGRFLIANINVYGETVPLSLNLDDKSLDGNQLCLTFFTYFKPLWNFHPMYVILNQTAGQSSKVTQLEVTPSPRWTLFKTDIAQFSDKRNRIEITMKRFIGTADAMAIDDIVISKGACSQIDHRRVIECDFESRTRGERNNKVLLSDGWEIKKGYDDHTLNGKLLGSFAYYKFDSCPGKSSSLTTPSLNIKRESCVKFWYKVNRKVALTSGVVKTVGNEVFNKYSDPAYIPTTRGLWLPVMFDNDVFNDWSLSITGACPDSEIIRRYEEPSLSIDDISIMRGKCDLDNSFTSCDFESDRCLWFSVSRGSFNGRHFLDTNANWKRHPAIEYLINTTTADVTFPVTDATGDSEGSYLLLENAQAREGNTNKKAIFLSPMFSWPETEVDSLTEGGVNNASVILNEAPSNETLSSDSSIACLSFWSIANHDHGLIVGKLLSQDFVSEPFSNDVSVSRDIWRQYFIPIKREADESRFFHLALIGTLRHKNNYVAIDNINLRMGEECPNVIPDFTCSSTDGDGTNITIDGSRVCDFQIDCPKGDDESNCGYECDFSANKGSKDFCRWKDTRSMRDSWGFRSDKIVSNPVPGPDYNVGLRSPQFKGSISNCNLNITYGMVQRFAAVGSFVDFQVFLSIQRQKKFMIFGSKIRTSNMLPSTAIINIGKIEKPFEIILNVKQDRGYQSVALAQYHLENCMKFDTKPDSVCASSENKCSNGKCIPLTDVCNLSDDCEDNSDEDGCFDGKDDWACSFEDYCDFIPTSNWRIQRAALGHPLIGPTRGHSSNSPKESVLFMKAPSGGKMTGTIETTDVKSKCFTLYYMAKNSSHSMIRVNGNNYQLEGEGFNWQKLFIPEIDRKIKLEISATVPAGAWIAIDDFSFGKYCDGDFFVTPTPGTDAPPDPSIAPPTNPPITATPTNPPTATTPAPDDSLPPTPDGDRSDSSPFVSSLSFSLTLSLSVNLSSQAESNHRGREREQKQDL